MKTEYEFIRFVEVQGRDLTVSHKRWKCENKRHGNELGFVMWFPMWRQWTFYANFGAVFSEGCLADIQSFLAQVKGEKVIG